MSEPIRPMFSMAPAPLFGPQATKPALKNVATRPSTIEVREGHELASSNLDWSRVYQLRERVTKAISDSRALGPDADNESRRQYSRTIIPSIIEEFSNASIHGGRREDFIAPALRPLYGRAVEEAIFGYGRWTPLLEDPEVENIELRGCEHTFMLYGDHIAEAPRVADSDQELIDQVQHLATYMASARKTFSETTPALTLNLGDRFRLHAMGFDIVDRPTIVIRQHKHVHVTLPELVELGMMPAHVADFMAAGMVAGLSWVVSGGMGAGKTTMLRAMAAALPPLRSIGVIETDPELFLHKLDGRWRVINMIARDGSPEAIGPNGRPAGEYGLERLLRDSKRQTLDMVSVGEILGSEAAVLFEAMQSGAGSFSTIHSQHAAATIERIVTAAAQGGVLSPEDAYRQVGTLLNLIVHIDTVDTRHLPGGRLERHVSQILEIRGFKETTDGRSTSMPATQIVYDARHPDQPLNISPEVLDRLSKIGWKGGLR